MPWVVSVSGVDAAEVDGGTRRGEKERDDKEGEEVSRVAVADYYGTPT